MFKISTKFKAWNKTHITNLSFILNGKNNTYKKMKLLKILKKQVYNKLYTTIYIHIYSIVKTFLNFWKMPKAVLWTVDSKYAKILCLH